jgi:hypothetical protein
MTAIDIMRLSLAIDLIIDQCRASRKLERGQTDKLDQLMLKVTEASTLLRAYIHEGLGT